MILIFIKKLLLYLGYNLVRIRYFQHLILKKLSIFNPYINKCINKWIRYRIILSSIHIRLLVSSDSIKDFITDLLISKILYRKAVIFFSRLILRPKLSKKNSTKINIRLVISLDTKIPLKSHSFKSQSSIFPYIASIRATVVADCGN